MKIRFVIMGQGIMEGDNTLIAEFDVERKPTKKEADAIQQYINNTLDRWYEKEFDITTEAYQKLCRSACKKYMTILKNPVVHTFYIRGGNTMSKYESLSRDIYKWCKKKHLWGDNCIYFDGKAWAAWDEWHGVKGKQIDEDLYEYEDKNPKDYFEFANPNTLSMSFEGALYNVLNANVKGCVKLETEFIKLFEKYGVFYELGYAWSLSVYES